MFKDDFENRHALHVNAIIRLFYPVQVVYDTTKI